MSRIEKIIQIILITLTLAIGGLIYIINRDFDEALEPVNHDELTPAILIATHDPKSAYAD